MDLSVLIPSRNEIFLGKTIENILENIQGDTEVITVLDGYTDPVPAIPNDPRVRLITEIISIGQRAATNKAARASEAKFVMKCDAHCAFDKGFDVKIIKDCEPNWTVIPRMYNLHAFDWKCNACGNRTYQGPEPTKCEKCQAEGKGFEMVVVWKPRWNRCSDYARFDRNLKFQYWGDFKNRPEAQGEITDVMSSIGACWMMPRQRYWDIDGMDEVHGSWGQMGTELACKSWLSGGRQVVNKRTWFAHMFRTQGGFSFPYPLSGRDVDKARERSRFLWHENRWPKAKHPLQWMINKFAPVPDWEAPTSKEATKSIIYYTDNRLESFIMERCQYQIEKMGLPIISASLKPINFGKNFVLPLERGYLTMFKQILTALENSTAEIIYFCEHDLLYHPSHFDFTPPRKDVFYYNEHTYKVDSKTGQALFYYTKQTSGLCAYRDLLIQHYRERVRRVSEEGFSRKMGFEPGTHSPPNGVCHFKAEAYWSEVPNIDIRHNTNLTESRWRQDQFRSQRSCKGWKLVDEVPAWGRTKDRFMEFLKEI
jgi:glycosyltransferase involved in cell wall biosynthesis